MHNAPSVTYPVGRSLLAGRFLLAAWLAGAAATGLWATQSAGPGWRHGAGCLVLAAAGLAAWWQWRRSVAGELVWDGLAWSWNDHAGAVTVNVDLQKTMLLRWECESNGQWLFLERSSSPAHWDALRRAVYSRAIPDALPEPEPAATT